MALIVKLTPLEQAVMDKILSGESELLMALRKQFALARALKRETGSQGFYLDFEVPKNKAAAVSPPSFDLGDAVAEVEGLRYGAGFILSVREGYITYLEGHTWGGEPWPRQIVTFVVGYPNELYKPFGEE